MPAEKRNTRFKIAKGPVMMLTVAFLLSRVAAYFAGVTFYGSFVHRLWQAIDVHLLRDELWTSLWYSHAQPPLFNLITGILVIVFPSSYMQAFHLLGLGLSLLMVIMVYFTMTLLDIPWRVALAVSLLIALNPALILYESVYAYTIITIFLLSASVFLLVLFLQTARVTHWVLFCSALALLVLTRSSFHLVWMAASIVILVFISAATMRKRMLFAAIVPLLLVSSWYVKNAILFGKFNSSSWLGMNLARMVEPETPLGNVGPFRPLEEYAGFYQPDTTMIGPNVLTQRRKQQTKYINFFHRDYLILSDRFMDESLEQIRTNPRAYLRRAGQSIVLFFCPATHAPFIDRNFSKISLYTRIMTMDISGFSRYRSVRGISSTNSDASRMEFLKLNHLEIVDAIPGALLFLLCITTTVLAWCKKQLTPVDRVLVVFLLFTFAYGMLVGTLLEFGENNRFRFEISLSIHVLLTLSIVRLYHFFKTTRLLSKD